MFWSSKSKPCHQHCSKHRFHSINTIALRDSLSANHISLNKVYRSDESLSASTLQIQYSVASRESSRNTFVSIPKNQQKTLLLSVHKSNILGDVGKSYKYMLEKLNDGRICAGAQGTGVSMACLQEVVHYLTYRKQFGQKIWDFQAIQHQVAEARTRLEAAQLLVYNATRKKQAGLPYTIESSMAKYYATETWSYIASKSVDWMGGVGFTKSYPVEKYYRDCKIGQIYEGTSNIQLNTIAKYWEMSGFPL